MEEVKTPENKNKPDYGVLGYFLKGMGIAQTLAMAVYEAGGIITENTKEFPPIEKMTAVVLMGAGMYLVGHLQHKHQLAKYNTALLEQQTQAIINQSSALEKIANRS